MSENKTSFRMSLDSLVSARGRETTSQVNSRMQHQLIGAFTKRP